ncbi:hypothetical protein CDCA_CDCA02G0630 [Cyanidium caldarium]|uniref:HIT-type domain-containing protein n=1 Tax=Cyanidium caldarium TaxID=2771 RepID=A0AAV9IQL7_CYACA|nr:hypothetical protein CDCA_CDCA02G0630 [Cyanidium caldarium]|eukprot:ctg_477.g143
MKRAVARVREGAAGRDAARRSRLKRFLDSVGVDEAAADGERWRDDDAASGSETGEGDEAEERESPPKRRRGAQGKAGGREGRRSAAREAAPTETPAGAVGLRPAELSRLNISYAELAAAGAQRELYFTSAVAAPSNKRRWHLCCVCGWGACYTCARCASYTCSLACTQAHLETRCLRYWG